MSAIALGDDGIIRCWWGDSTAQYRDYHDPNGASRSRTTSRLFEKLCLEGFQAGLSWLTILRKREAFRRRVRRLRARGRRRLRRPEVERLLGDAGIVRHRGKIESTINNARRALELVEAEGSLAAYVWRFEPDRAGRVPLRRAAPTTDESRALAKDLKRRGWTFVGPTTVYAFMQAMGLSTTTPRAAPRAPRPSGRERRSRRRRAEALADRGPPRFAGSAPG